MLVWSRLMVIIPSRSSDFKYKNAPSSSIPTPSSAGTQGRIPPRIPLWAKEQVLSIMPDKTKEDRLSEGLELLRALLGVNVSTADPSYLDFKSKVSEWVSSGKTWEGRIDFPNYGKYADVRLPKSSLTTATLAFKSKKGSYPNL